MSPPRRHLGMALLLPLLGLAPATPAAADQGVARDVVDACGYAPTSTFSDRPDDGAGEAVDCVAHYGITTGATPTTYAPLVPVTRAQMASFVVRAGEVAGVVVAPPDGDPFDDDDGSVHEGAIGRLAASGVATGFPDGTFRPLTDVSRGQMASFIARELALLTGAELPAAGADHFSDDDGTTHEAAIDQLAAIGVVAGTGDGRYAPDDPVTRGQMALFLSRSLDWLTEARGAALARIGIADATGSPELVGATQATSGMTTTVSFDFDEGVSSSTIVVSGFAVVGYDGAVTTATSLTRDAADPSLVRATFPASAARLATKATVDRNAVQDPSGNLGPEGSVGLRAVTLLPGSTSAPDLFGVSRLGATTVDFNFDEQANVVEPTGYHLLLSDGSVLDSTGATGDGTNSHNVTFPTLTTTQSSQVVRAYVDAVTVSDTAQAPPATPARPDVVEGTANPQQAVAVTTGGSLGGVPDLLAVTLDPEADRVLYTFDEAVDLVPAANPLIPPTPFRLYDLDGAEVTSGDATEVEGDNRTVAVTFSPGDVDLLDAGASVDAGAVTSSATAATNRVDEEGLAQTFGAGETAAPDLLRTGRVQQTAGGPLMPSKVRRVVFELDQEVALLSPTAFSVYSPTGARNQLTGCVADGRTVVCSVEAAADPALYAAIGNAARAGLQQGALEDAAGSARSAAGSDVL